MAAFEGKILMRKNWGWGTGSRSPENVEATRKRSRKRRRKGNRITDAVNVEDLDASLNATFGSTTPKNWSSIKRRRPWS